MIKIIILAATVKILVMITMVMMRMLLMTTYLEVREDMERGLLLSRGSVPTGGLCCGRLHIVIIIII